MRLLLAATAIVILFAHAVGAAAADPVKLGITSVEEQQDRMTVVVTALDANGQALRGLTPANFRAELDGTPLSVTDVQLASEARLPTSVLLVVDTSGSMLGDPMEQAKRALQEFVRNLEPNDSVALVGFDSAVTPLLDFTSNRTVINQAISRLTARGDTALYDAVLEASRRVSNAPGRRLVVLLSDGLSTLSPDRRDASIAAANASGVSFVTLGLGSGIDRQYLGELAAATGGRFLEAPTPDSLRQTYVDLAASIRNQYQLLIAVPPSVDRSVPGKLTLTYTSRTESGSVERILQPRPGAEPPALDLGLAGISANQKLSESLVVSPQVAPGVVLSRVEYSVDGAAAQAITQAPFELSLDPSLLQPGAHVLRVTATDQRGRQAEAQVPFVVASPAAGGLPVMLPVALVLLAVVGGGGYLLLKRRLASTSNLDERVHPFARRGVQPAASLEGWKVEAPPARPVRLPQEPKALGRVVVMNEEALRTGSMDAIQEYELMGAALTLGTNYSCDIRLTDEEGLIAPEEARLWVQRDRLVYHKLTTLSAMATEGITSGWAFLESGEELRVGKYRLMFMKEEQKVQEAEAPDDTEQTPLRPGSLSDMWMGLAQDTPS